MFYRSKENYRYDPFYRFLPETLDFCMSITLITYLTITFNLNRLLTVSFCGLKKENR